MVCKPQTACACRHAQKLTHSLTSLHSGPVRACFASTHSRAGRIGVARRSYGEEAFYKLASTYFGKAFYLDAELG